MANEPGPTGYHTGTATVAQDDTLVTFQDAGNLFDIVKAGDDFGSHVGMPIRIKSLDRANSQLTLAYKWPGQSQTAAPYEISFNPYILTYRQAVQTILKLLKSGNVAALAGLTGEADTMPYFTGPGQMGRTGLTPFAREVLGQATAADMRGEIGVPRPPTTVRSNSSVNWNTIDSDGWYQDLLSGSSPNGPPYSGYFFLLVIVHVGDNLTQVAYPYANPASISGGIYFRGRYQNSWTPWRRVYTQANILDDVSQSGGFPTGGIFERGGNSNGSYIRYADGTQLCWNQSIQLQYSNGSNLDAQWDFPAAFTATPDVKTQLNFDSYSSVFRGGGGGTRDYHRQVNSTKATVGVASSSLFSSGDENLDVMTAYAAGRWF